MSRNIFICTLFAFFSICSIGKETGDIASYISISRNSYFICSSKVVTAANSLLVWKAGAEVAKNLLDGVNRPVTSDLSLDNFTRVDQDAQKCIYEYSKWVSAEFSNLKKVLKRDQNTQVLLLQHQDYWMQAILSIPVSGTGATLSSYTERQKQLRDGLKEIGIKLIVSYCKQNLSCMNQISSSIELP